VGSRERTVEYGSFDRALSDGESTTALEAKGQYAHMLPSSTPSAYAAPAPAFSSAALSPSPPVPPELRSFTYQHASRSPPATAAAAGPPPSFISGQSEHAQAEPLPGSDDEEEENNQPPPPPAAPKQLFDDASVVPPHDLLAPPLSPQQMEELYRLTASDYMAHLADCLRVRVTAFLLLLASLFTCVYLSQANWMVVLGCVYLMIAALCAIRGSLRGEQKFINYVSSGYDTERADCSYHTQAHIFFSARCSCPCSTIVLFWPGWHSLHSLLPSG
jgi:hypothetical protein